MASILSTSNLSYKIKEKNIFSNISFEVMPSQVVSIIGANGSGKTSLLKSIMGLAHGGKISGDVFLSKKKLNSLPRKEIAKILAYAPQHLEVFPDFSVLEYVALARFANSDLRDLIKAKESLETCLCEPLAEQSFRTLSGGERQRVMLAASICQEPKLLLLDEPFSAMDAKSLCEMSDLIFKLKQQQISSLLVLHDINLAIEISDKILFLNAGKQLFFGTPSQMLAAENFEKLFDGSYRKVEDDLRKYPLLVPCLKTEGGT